MQHCGGRVGVGRAFFKAFVFAHGLVVQILAVHHEQHLVDTGQIARELRGLEAGQRLAAAGGVPDIAASGQSAQLPQIGGPGDPLQNLFGGDDLIGAHHQQLAVHVEHAIARQDVEHRMFGKEGLGEASQIGDGLVLRIGPPARECKTVGTLLAAALSALFGQMAIAHGVAVIFG